MHELSKVLNSCEKYDIKKFRNLSKRIDTSNKNNFSCLCNNIDGNASNFDRFTAEILSQDRNSFSVIAVTETNIEVCHKDLYQLTDYTSEYNEKFPGNVREVVLGYMYITSLFLAVLRNIHDVLKA